jgi:hypothetical protein
VHADRSRQTGMEDDWRGLCPQNDDDEYNSMNRFKNVIIDFIVTYALSCVIPRFAQYYTPIAQLVIRPVFHFDQRHVG